ncbi:MAG: gliding motility lipoprotein GldD [Bacteroidetes bacterium]|nr:gliding motility lipoprotein GldD [Bacteroidota bacterium]MBU1580351.1 gliding motility lipoprotein GldD [Bacteroidota bacterium]MBU2557874.1 gliding motility lipoprotein GldD [Bacteroidota bacterium]
MLLFVIIVISSCEADYAPKPRGYFRIDMPVKNFQLVDSIPAYQFESPEYAVITPDYNSAQEENWFNMEFPQFKGSLHISHKKIENNLPVYLEDMHTMLMQHLPKATAITDSLIVDKERNVYGLLFSIQGKRVASPLQFYLTDSTSNFVRGALYFNIRPNNDSLKPVIGFLREDIDHFIETLEWKD